MNCYLCWRETDSVSQAALGICHECGAGICAYHQVTIVSKPVVGMATRLTPLRRLLCSLCYETQSSPPSARPLRQAKPAGQPLFARWKRFWHPHHDDLPRPEEAVTLVERWLKRQRSR